jgi:hypothetical protein
VFDVTFVQQLIVRSVGAATMTACGARTPLDLSDSPSDGGYAADAFFLVDGAPAACGGNTPIEVSYLLDGDGVLYRYDPLAAGPTTLGAPNCGNVNVPWTMTVSRENAYVVYTDWTLYAVDLATLACSPTAFHSGQLGLDEEFGVAVSASGGTERLFVYGEPSSGGNPILAVSDLSSFALTKVGDILPPPPAETFPVNLAADATGLLYAFSPGGYLQQIEAATGAVVQAARTGVVTMSTWASLTAGTSVFLFVDSTVDGYDLTMRSTTSTHDIGVSAIGAGTVVACPSSSPR